MNQKIFKAYDIRGVYPEELNEETAYKTGRAFAEFIKKSSHKERPQIAVGRDNRKSSDSLFDSLSLGITEQGADVINIGLTATPTLYFSVSHYKCDGGINVTASHNPKQYNGMKMVRENAIPISGDSGIYDIRDMAVAGEFTKAEVPGKIINQDVIKDYVAFNKISDKFDFKVVVDTANSVSGVLVPEMFDNLNLVHLHSELDGDFPNHEPDPLKKENLVKLQQKIIEEKADLGVAFDGDGDRVFLIDEKGEVISSDVLLALIASVILSEDRSRKILYDLRCSNIVRETVEKMNGTAILSRVGHSFIKELMRKEDVFFGAEFAGHYYLKQGSDYFESPYIAVYYILEEMKKTGQKLSQLVEPFKKYYHSGEINFKVEDKEKIIGEIKDRYKKGKLLTIDGIRIDFDDWWLSVRASNTEPILRLIVEAKTKEKTEEKVAELQKIIQA